MQYLPNWLQYAVTQRNDYGCIPTGYEFLLRAADIPNIDFNTFQEDMDLDLDLRQRGGRDPQNNFESVMNRIVAKYPHVQITTQPFVRGEEKLKCLENRFDEGKFTIVSIPGVRSWHISPLIGASHTAIQILNRFYATGQAEIVTILKADLVRVHNEKPGGRDIAFLTGH